MNNVVVAKSAWFSRINWTQGIAFVAMMLAVFQIDLDPETQKYILAGIVSVQATITWILRTWFNNSVAPELAGRTVTIQKA